MRELTTNERKVILWFAKRIDQAQGTQLLDDLESAVVEADDGSTLRFGLRGYTRPPYRGERPIRVDAIVADRDGAQLSVVLSTDENGRLFELELIRYEPGHVVDPDWRTLRALGPDNILDLDREP